MVVIHGKNALIVGGLGGMGQVIASKLIKNGLEVFDFQSIVKI